MVLCYHAKRGLPVHMCGCVELDYNSCTSVCANSIMWNVNQLLDKELAPLRVCRYRGSRYSSEAIIQLQPDPATLTACVWPSGKELVWDELHPFRVHAIPLWDPAKNKCVQGKGNVFLHSLHGRVEVSSYHRNRDSNPGQGSASEGPPRALWASWQWWNTQTSSDAHKQKCQREPPLPGESGVGCQLWGAKQQPQERVENSHGATVWSDESVWAAGVSQVSWEEAGENEWEEPCKVPKLPGRGALR